MLTADQIIDALGSTSNVASELGLTPSTVSTWRGVNFIPTWRQPAVLALAKRKKYALTAADFPPAESRQSKPKRSVAA